MRELSLFTGAGGGLLGTRLMNWRCMGAVEIDKFCCERVAQRRDEGHLGEWFPVWNMDIREFNRRVAPNYRGLIDVVSAGFPCQPFSVAGKQRAADDERNMWPATIECIRVVQPRFCFLENVPGLLSRKHRYFETILKDLAESGYDARWKVISAAEVGAPHKRDRLWVVAVSRHAESPRRGEAPEGTERTPRTESAPCSSDVADAKHCGQQRRDPQGDGAAAAMSCGWWTIEPDVGRMAHGVASRVDRLKAIGNGQVPSVVRTAWELLGPK